MPDFATIKNMYKCNKCSKEFEKKQSYCAHRSHCQKAGRKNFSGWNKGLTKDIDSRVANNSNKQNEAYWKNKLKGRTFEQYCHDEVFILDRWRTGYALKYALLRCNYIHDFSCQQCGWKEINPTTGTIPTEVDHIDGNNKNNLQSNLRILCPNCHSLTPTYCGANKKTNKNKDK